MDIEELLGSHCVEVDRGWHCWDARDYYFARLLMSFPVLYNFTTRLEIEAMVGLDLALVNGNQFLAYLLLALFTTVLDFSTRRASETRVNRDSIAPDGSTKSCAYSKSWPSDSPQVKHLGAMCDDLGR